MTRNNLRDLDLCSDCGSWKSRAARISLVTACLASCSLRDLSELGPGNSGEAQGGSSSGGTAGSGAKGGGPGFGGSFSGASGTNTAAGGAGVTGGSVGTDTSAGGASGGGGATTTSVTGGSTAKPTCPAYSGSGGIVVRPPSNDFETDVGGWVRVASVYGVTRVVDANTACDGSAYLYCEGKTRTYWWDGPAIDIQDYLVAGHTYAVTAVLRFSAENALTEEHQVGLTSAAWCDSAASANYVPLSTTLTAMNWVRVKAQFNFPPAGCKVVNRYQLYVETVEADKKLSIDMDDFRLIDVTEPSGGGGAAGGPGVGGSNGTLAGAAGTAGSGT